MEQDDEYYHPFMRRRDIWITMTINSLNYDSVEDLTDEWNGRTRELGGPIR